MLRKKGKKEREKEEKREYGSQVARKREREREKRRVKKEGERGKDQCNSNGFKRVVFKARRPKESAGQGQKIGTKTKRKREKGTRMKRKEGASERGMARCWGKGWDVVRDRKGRWTTYGAAGNIRRPYFFAFQSNFVKRSWEGGEAFPLFKRTLPVRSRRWERFAAMPTRHKDDSCLESDFGTLPCRLSLPFSSEYFPTSRLPIKLTIDRLRLASCNSVNFSR